MSRLDRPGQRHFQHRGSHHAGSARTRYLRRPVTRRPRARMICRRRLVFFVSQSLRAEKRRPRVARLTFPFREAYSAVSAHHEDWTGRDGKDRARAEPRANAKAETMCKKELYFSAMRP